jgi:DNA polymerase-1
MSRYVFDIEADGLLRQCTKMWVISFFNIDTEKQTTFVSNDDGVILDETWKEIYTTATDLKGHFISGFDIPAIEKLFKIKPNKKCRITDTLVLSQVLNYKRFPSGKHSLEEWGYFFNYPKYSFNDWSHVSPEMVEYCEQDVRLNVKVYKALSKEFNSIKNNQRLYKYIYAEQRANQWNARAEIEGWPFDVENAVVLEGLLKDKMQEAYDALSKKLGTRTERVDEVKGVVEVKQPKWTKQGFYDRHLCDWFGIEPPSGFEGEERLVEGPYCRVKFVPLSLDSSRDVKIFLYRNGWVPTEWNTKIDPETNKRVKTSPKITEDSLEFLGGDGKLYTEFLSAKSRHSILSTWLENIDVQGNLHGSCKSIGTPSMRATHSIIVNVPSGDAPWGKEMRSLFITKPGWKLIGCDSSGNQARGLAHYLNDPTYINTLLTGDIHQYNADTLTAVLKDLGFDYTVTRSQAKRVLYAFLFGASGGKLWSYIFGTLDMSNGNKLKNGFMKAVPGFKNLVDRLEGVYSNTRDINNGDGYITSLVGSRIYVDSYHKLLVYLLQCTEKITCVSALARTMDKLEELEIPYIPCIFYHDEIQFMVPEEHAETARVIGKESFKEAPKDYGITIMDGEARIGENWYETH